MFLHIFNGLECARLWSECDESLHSLKIGIKEDELSLAFLSATVVLINACEVESIPQSLSEAFLRILKEIRVRVSGQEVIRGARKCNKEGRLYKSNIAVSNLAESIFRLSI